jgi:hypothetical protein
MVAFRLYEFYGIISIITVPYIVYTLKSRLLSLSIVIAYSLFIMFIKPAHKQSFEPYKLFDF